tara:strand:- start:336 stop:863 length:528 start_codon:yes stop_codon:yes gene_type:complete
MKNLFSLVALIFINVISADVIVEEGQIVRLKIDRYRGTWTIPPGNFVERLKIKVTKFSVVNGNEDDKRIVEAIESGQSFDVILADRALTYSMYRDDADYKYLSKHNVRLTSLVRPNLYFTGTLQYGVNNYETIEAINLVMPVFSSELGKFSTAPEKPLAAIKSIRKKQFNLIHRN